MKSITQKLDLDNFITNFKNFYARDKSIEMMGDKIVSRLTVEKFNVPTVPGTKDAITDIDQALLDADIIGYPIMVKASAGGGGKGMRVVYSKKDMKSAIEATQREAASSFANDLVNEFAADFVAI